MINKNTKIGAAIDAATPMPAKTKKAKDLTKISPQGKKAFRSAIELMTEIVIVVLIGAMIGSYVSSKSVQDDCKRIGVSKVGDGYINCSIVEPHKADPATPPR